MKADVLRARWSMDDMGIWLNILLKGRRAQEFVSEVSSGKEYELEIKRKKKKRSLNANAYCWVLIGKISAVAGVPPREIYRNAIKEIGGNYEVLSVRDEAVFRFRSAWEDKGIGWICEAIGASDTPYYTDLMCFYGSSAYDAQQMSRLIDIIVQDAKALEIETLTPAELERMCHEWTN